MRPATVAAFRIVEDVPVGVAVHHAFLFVDGSSFGETEGKKCGWAVGLFALADDGGFHFGGAFADGIDFGNDS